MRPVLDFSELIAPAKASDFFKTHYGRQPFLCQADAGLYQSLFGWDDVSEMLEMTNVWTGETLKIVMDQEIIAPAEYCRSAMGRDGARVLRPQPARVKAWMEKGASIVLDLAEFMTPGLRSISEAIALATNNVVTANIYCSYAGHQAFTSHYDTTDVFVMQIDGKKKWRIYEGQFPEPYTADGFYFSSFDQAHHDRAKGKVAMNPTMQPGNFLYVPKGRYHDAVATDGPSLHVTFATTQPRGVDFLQTMVNSLVEVPEFRQALPDFDDEDAHSSHIHMLADRLKEILKQPGIAEQMRDDQRRRAFQDMSRFSLPDRENAVIYRVCHVQTALSLGAGGHVLKVQGQEVDVVGQELAAVEWMLNRSGFFDSQLAAAAPDIEESDRSELLSRLIKAGLLEEIVR